MTDDYSDEFDEFDDDDYDIIKFIPIINNLNDRSAQWSSPVQDRNNTFVVEQINPNFVFVKSPEQEWLIDNFKTHRLEDNYNKYLYGTKRYSRFSVWFVDKSYAYMFYMKFSNGG